MMQVGTILWAKNRPGDHNDHLHVEPRVKMRGTPPLKNPGMSPGVKLIYDAVVAEFGPGHYFQDPPGNARWSHMGWYNRRKIAGTDTWSQHAYANAIDIGPYVGVKAQQRFFDFLTGNLPPGDDDMASKGQIMWVDFAFNAFPDEFIGDANEWYALDENDPAWDSDFRPAIGRAGQKLWLERQGHPHSPGDLPDHDHPLPQHDHPARDHTHNVTGRTT